MLDKEEIADFAQERFDCDKKHANLFAEDLIKHNRTKQLLVDWIPQIFAFGFLIVYLIFHW